VSGAEPEATPGAAPEPTPEPAPEPAPEPTPRLPGWAEAVIVGIVSRGFALAVLFVSWAVRLPAPIGQHWSSPLIIWDAQWYLWVARQGYHAGAVAQTAFGSGYHDFAFFPLYPGLIAILSLGGRLPLEIVAPVISNVLFVLALIPIRIVLERATDRKIGRFGLLLFAFSPAAYVYSLGYSEPLFLLIAGLFLLTSNPVKGGVLGFLAGLTRLTFAALALASLPDLFDPKTRWRGIAGVGGLAVAFAAWWSYIAVITHDFWGYMRGSPAWYSMDGPTGSLTGLASILNAQHPAVWVTVAFIAVYLVGTLALLRRREYRLGIFSVACLASAVLVTWNTMPRLFAVGFPAFAGLAAVLPNDRARWLVVALSVVTEAVIGALAVSGYVVP
jgi:hypothetical protein